MKYILLSIFIFSNFLFSSEVQVTGLKNKNPERVLYIGNSYLYYNDSLHNHVRRMLEEFYANEIDTSNYKLVTISCLLYTSPSPRDKRQSRMPSSA